MNIAEMTYAELFAAAVAEARRKDIQVRDDTPPNVRLNAMAGLINSPDVFPSIEAFAQHAAQFNPRSGGVRTDDFDNVWTGLGKLSCPVLFVRAGDHSHLTDEVGEFLSAAGLDKARGHP
jgi:hypothetical protein